ncbi:bifunctional DNA-formamidopyrimidine glycosylase/DNA-(apurinic or apyrimidinic site) lyase [Patescibacteria group bacterium]|nr:MAG: bifunctional DNA-formamidopyrimidine glycosylase/DNA-(apurinic or apyrimidinic site) lyase [Patescibacteria group bacterium]
MPELPEVETIKRQLLKEVIGKKIKEVELRLPKLAYFEGFKGDGSTGSPQAAKNFKKNLEGAKIGKADRAAKILILTLSNDYTLLVHLKMTGQLIYRAKNGKMRRGGHPWPPAAVEVPNKWTHIIFHFVDGSKLYFNDLRQFGYMKLVKSDELAEQKEIRKLGIEPFDKNFTVELFSKMLKCHAKAKIKPLLMDQNFISGIGNIYADESLHYAGILPTRPAGKIKPEEVKRLYQGIKIILKKSIAKGGTSSDTYVTLSGQKGGYEKYLKVYGREGKKCLRCGGIIKRIKLGGRSAHFCPDCQG